jgi:hypothetical protein
VLGRVLTEHDHVGVDRREDVGDVVDLGVLVPEVERRDAQPGAVGCGAGCESGNASGAARTPMPTPIADATVTMSNCRRRRATSTTGTSAKAKYGVSDWGTATTAEPDRPTAWLRMIRPTNATISHARRSMTPARVPP